MPAKKHKKFAPAVILGSRGGKKGGPARAKKLPKGRRVKIAKMGGEARKKQQQQQGERK